MDKPEYFEPIRRRASQRWDQLESDPDLAAPWHQLFQQVQSPRHVISELLQNADDAGAKKATVEFNSNEFRFTHNGNDFNEEQFESLCRFGYSNKRILHTIGFRGVGFKSTFSIGNKVCLYTPTLSVAFERQRFTEPIWISESVSSTTHTEIRIQFQNEEVKHALNQNIQDWYDSPVSLLFFRNIRMLQVHDREISWYPKGTGPIEDSEWVSTSTAPDETHLIIRSPLEEIPADAQKEIFSERMLNDHETTLPPCQIEIVLGMEGRLFVVLPTELKTQLPFACNAPFIQDAARLRIKDPATSPTNTWLLQRAGQLAAEAMLTWLGQKCLPIEVRSNAYGLLPDVDRSDSSIQGVCGTIVEESFQEHTEGKQLLITETLTLEHSGCCFSVPRELLQIWPPDQISHGFSSQVLPILSRHVTRKDRHKLENWDHTTSITIVGVLEKLKTSNLPRPKFWWQLARLWAYVANYVTLPHSDYLNLRIVPVQGEDTLYPPDEVVRISERSTLQSTDLDFLEDHVLKLDPNWVQLLQASDSAAKFKDKITANQLRSALDVLRAISLHEATTIAEMFQCVLSNFNSKHYSRSNEDCVRLAHIAAKLNVTSPSNFPFITLSGDIRTLEECPLLVDLDNILCEYLDQTYHETHVLHSDYMLFTNTCTRAEWVQWVRSSKSRLLTFVPIDQISVKMYNRDKLIESLRLRGFEGKPHFHYKSDNFEVMDWDFNSIHVRHWNSLAETDSKFWAKLMAHILEQPHSYWSTATSAKVRQWGYTYAHPVTQTSLLPRWIVRFRKLHCLLDTWGRPRQPAELLRRTPETDVLRSTEVPFVDARLDTVANQPVLDLLGVRNNPTGPRPLLQLLQELTCTSPPLVSEVKNKCHALDQLFRKCSAKERQEIKTAFNNSRLILTEQNEWATSGEVCLDSDEDKVPGIALIHPSLRELTFWHKIGVPMHLTAEMMIEQLKRLPPNMKPTAVQDRRIRRLMHFQPHRVWDECGHWLNLIGEWVSIENLDYSLTEQSPVLWGYLFSSIKAATADFRLLSSEMYDSLPFSSSPRLEDVIEQRFQGQPELPRKPTKKEWMVVLGRGLRRMVLDDVEQMHRIREVASRLEHTQCQVADGMESVPYIDGNLAGSPQPIEVLWQDRTLYVQDSSAVKMVNPISQELGREFGESSIADAIKFCYERAPELITEYLEEHFSLISEECSRVDQLTVSSSVPANLGLETDPLPDGLKNGVSTRDTNIPELNRSNISKVSVVNHESENSGSSAGGFAREFHGVWIPTPLPARDNPVVHPSDGPNTHRAARDHTIRASNVGRSESYELKLVEKLERGPMGRALEEEFRSMVHGDYGKRCQICGRTFAKPSGDWQVNVVHVVPPMTDARANHFGDLLGLCGWHFNLLQYGQGTLFDPNTDQPFEDVDGTSGWQSMREFILNRPRDVDSWGNEYVGLPIRFANVYRKWKSEPEPIDEEIRYSIPHWKYLCELLKT